MDSVILMIDDEFRSDIRNYSSIFNASFLVSDSNKDYRDCYLRFCNRDYHGIIVEGIGI